MNIRQVIHDLADELDWAAEDIAAEDFIHLHRALAALLAETIGLGPTLEVLRKLEAEGGLHGLMGINGVGPKDGGRLFMERRRDIFKECGLWELPESLL